MKQLGKHGRALLLRAAALAPLVACQASPSPAPTGTAIPSAEAASEIPTTAPRPTAVDPASVDLHVLDVRFVPADAPVSADGQVLWTATGPGRHPSEIWRYVPGAAEPERIYVSSHADGSISAIAASGAGYAFVEESDKAYGKGGWRLWFLAHVGGEPVEVDRGSAPGAGVAPTIAMDAERIAWAAFDEPPGGPVSRLRVAPLGNLQTVMTLIDAPIAERLLWYPTLDGQELWYATILAHGDATGDGDEFHLEHIDLTQGLPTPIRFAGRGNDFSPAVDDRFVVWKTVEPGYAALNWGVLRVLDRQTDEVRTIPFELANRPSIGDRFVAFDEITHARLVVYDLTTWQTLELGRSEADAPIYGGLSVSGSLLAFSMEDPDIVGRPRIGWAIMPE